MKKIKKNPNGYYGSSCRSGYQSHYTIVKERKGGSYPIETTNPNKNKTANELVVYQDPQAIPLFIISQKQLNWESINPSTNVFSPTNFKQQICKFSEFIAEIEAYVSYHPVRYSTPAAIHN